MKMIRTLALGAAMAVASTAALAFQEQQVGTPEPVKKAAEPIAEAGTTPNAEFKAPSGDAQGGTEVRIPGLGKLGVLPKMDFGLELLYGAAETNKPDEPEAAPNSDDLMIRGSVKHRF